VNDEDKAAEILRRAKAERRGSSRGLWIVAAVVGVACTIGFVWLFVGERSATPTPLPKRVVEDQGLGFGAGILVGVVVGIAIGFAIGRHRQSSRSTP
jgi:hypothetical protein